MYILDHITQENGKWFAEIKNEEITKREHTGNIWGWDGMSYSSLKCILEEYYNIKINFRIVFHAPYHLFNFIRMPNIILIARKNVTASC